jgi:uncharacterized membrane protein YphA (DoxX/SURF4 family)
MKEIDSRLTNSYWALRILFGVVPIVAGLDKFFNLLTNWEQYLSPLATKVVPLTPVAFMHVVGVIEIIAGLIVLTRTKLGSYVVMLWLLGIALNLFTTGKYFDIAVRDVGLAVAAFTLAQLAEVCEREKVAYTQPATVRA